MKKKQRGRPPKIASESNLRDGARVSGTRESEKKGMQGAGKIDDAKGVDSSTGAKSEAGSMEVKSTKRELSLDPEVERARKGKAIAEEKEITQEEFPALETASEAKAVQGASVTQKRDFASLFKDNRQIADAHKLDFHPEVVKGKMKVTMEDREIAGKEWSATLIGVVAGNNVMYNTVRVFAETNWKDEGLRVYQKGNGVFIFKFKTEAQRDWVLLNGPWEIEGSKPITLKKWCIGMPICWEVFEKIPVWTCLPDIDPALCNSHMLGKLGSAIGTPICMDNITATCERLSYARILVEVTAEEAQRKELEIEHCDGKIVHQRVNFEWLPWSCSSCRRFGHTKDRCAKFPVVRKAGGNAVWVPKKTLQGGQISQGTKQEAEAKGSDKSGDASDKRVEGKTKQDLAVTGISRGGAETEKPGNKAQAQSRKQLRERVAEVSRKSGRGKETASLRKSASEPALSGNSGGSEEESGGSEDSDYQDAGPSSLKEVAND